MLPTRPGLLWAGQNRTARRWTGGPCVFQQPSAVCISVMYQMGFLDYFFADDKSRLRERCSPSAQQGQVSRKALGSATKDTLKRPQACPSSTAKLLSRAGSAQQRAFCTSQPQTITLFLQEQLGIAACSRASHSCGQSHFPPCSSAHTGQCSTQTAPPEGQGGPPAPR